MNQHYVPQVYLRNFAKKQVRKKQEFFHIDVYDKTENRFFPTNIINICGETHLYTLDDNSTIANDILAVENLYSRHLEPLYDRAYRTLIDDNIRFLGGEDIVKIILGVLQMYMRNPAQLRSVTKYHEQQLVQCYNKAKSNQEVTMTYMDEIYNLHENSIDQIQEHFSKVLIKEFKEKHTLLTREIVAFHADAKLEISKIEDDSVFFTCDNPIIIEDHLTSDTHPLLRSKEFILTLNPKYMLRVFHDNTLPPNQIFRQNTLSGSVTLINEKIIENAHRFVMMNESSFEYYQYVKSLLDDTSTEGKIDALRQIWELVKDDTDDLEFNQHILDEIQRYERTGIMTPEDEQRFMAKSKAMLQKKIERQTKETNH